MQRKYWIYDMNVMYKECVNSLHGSVFETVALFSNRYGRHILPGVKKWIIRVL